jgi:hypothetical protein
VISKNLVSSDFLFTFSLFNTTPLLGLALVVRINEAYGTIEEDEIFDQDGAA